MPTLAIIRTAHIKTCLAPEGPDTFFVLKGMWPNNRGHFLQPFYCHGKILAASDTDDLLLRNGEKFPADTLAQAATHQQYSGICLSRLRGEETDLRKCCLQLFHKRDPVVPWVAPAAVANPNSERIRHGGFGGCFWPVPADRDLLRAPKPLF